MKRIAFVLVLLLSAITGSAAAHSELVKAEPEPGAQLAESPAEVRLTFSEPVAATSQIVLLAGDFQPVDGLVPQFNAARPEEVYTPLPELEPGTYTVQWTAASDDGHQVSGSYSFSVGLVTPGADSDTSAPTEESSSSTGPAWWMGTLVAVAVGLPLVLLALRRAGRR